METDVYSIGGHRYKNGSVYVGSWNNQGQKHGEGHLLLPNGIRYDGLFENDLFSGYGVLTFTDGAKYEGEFYKGWFHGYGTFWRTDGMRHEGEYRGGRIYGLGLLTFSDGTNGFPRNEGYFQDSQMKYIKKCPEVVQKAQRISFLARQKANTE